VGEKGQNKQRRENGTSERIRDRIDPNNPDSSPKPRIEQPTINKLFLDNHNRPALNRPEFYQIRELKAIVLHWTANLNKGANAKANRDYFNSTQRKASAHFIVDEKEVIQCLPLNEVAYHCGDRNHRILKKDVKKYGYTKFGFSLLDEKRLTPNFYTIGVEMCVNSDGDFKETLRRTVKLIRYLKSIHGNVPLVRHYDITGKKCPKHKVHGKWKMIDKIDWKLLLEYCKI